MTAQSDEGMWLFNQPPTEILKSRHGFDLTEDWLKHAQLASIRFNNGGSGSFISRDGLIITNHHIGSDAMQKLSTTKLDILHNGYHARQRSEELKCPDLELNVLQEMIDVTDLVNGSVKPEMKAAESNAARRAEMSRIEKESLLQTGLRSDVVTLYQGGAYHLYRYKKYTDVRLVFSPEQEIAAFGGDVDNFEYPRFNLDICFFRAYENDKPAKIQHFLKFSAEGAKNNDLVFVTGHPGTTNRLETLAKLKHRRDYTLPYSLARLRAFEAALHQFSERDPEFRRLAANDLHRVANARKAFTGQFHGLLDASTLRTKEKQEEELNDKLKSLESKLGEDYSSALVKIAEVQKQLRQIEKEHSLFERGDALFSELFGTGKHLVRLTEELTKPNSERLREYRDSNLESLYFQLYSPAEIDPILERTKLTVSLAFMAEQLGLESPMVQTILAGKSPAKRAEELVAGTILFDATKRKALVEGGKQAISTSNDSMILLAKLIDPKTRELRQIFETTVEEPERQAFSAISKARFAVYGKNLAPDATFTLRLAFGVVKGYDVDRESLDYCTTFGQVFRKAERMRHREPFRLPESFMKNRDKIDPATPFNFVSTADTIGGNSGSPVLNRAGEFVGINFDRNRHGLVRNFVYTDVQARHIAVHSKGILEVLRKNYDAKELLEELGNR
jgi:hypothetical protein